SGHERASTHANDDLRFCRRDRGAHHLAGASGQLGDAAPRGRRSYREDELKPNTPEHLLELATGPRVHGVHPGHDAAKVGAEVGTSLAILGRGAACRGGRTRARRRARKSTDATQPRAPQPSAFFGSLEAVTMAALTTLQRAPFPRASHGGINLLA